MGTSVVLRGPLLGPVSTAIQDGEPTTNDELDKPQGFLGQGANDQPDDPQQMPMRGKWLEAPEAEVAKEIDQLWQAQNPAMKNRIARWDLNERRREGDLYSKLVFDVDLDMVRVYTPKGAEQAPPSLNKTDELCEKMVANLLVDPPSLECEPSKDDDAADDAAEFATRALIDQANESGIDFVDAIDEAEDIACSTGSGFVRVYIDPTGGGSKPKQVMASMVAQTVQDAILTTVQDPITGQPVQRPQPEPYLLRYVTAEGMLTDDPMQADKTWLPKLRREVLSGRHVRFLPETSTGIADADGVIIASYVPFARLKQMFPRVQQMSPEEQRSLVSYRPAQTKGLLPKWAGDGKGTSKLQTTQAGPPDDAQVLVMTAMMTERPPDHPDGAYVCMAGGRFLLHRQPWVRLVTDPTTKKQEVRPNSIWLAQFKQYWGAKDRDPYGRGLVDKVIDGDPLLAIATGSLIEYVYKANNPHMFVPIGSGISEKMLSLPRGTPLPWNPSAGGTIVYEQLTPFSPQVMELYKLVDERMNSRSGLEETAQGVENKNSQSGKAKQLVIEQSLVALVRIKRNMEKGAVRLGRITLEAMQMGLTEPQMLRIAGDDGSYKYKEWTATDLGTTVDVKITAGSSTMLNPTAKAQIALNELQVGAISLDDYKNMRRTNLRTQIGWDDDPSLLRIRRQITDWSQGPPQGWQPMPPQVDPATGQPQPVADPSDPFSQRLPSDEEPEVAKIRHLELLRLLESTKYSKWPPDWQALVLQEYQLMRYAAGISTLREQAQAAQQQQAAHAQEHPQPQIRPLRGNPHPVRPEAASPFQQARQAAGMAS